MLVRLPDMSMIGHMNTPDYQANPDVWDWDAMPDPTIDDLVAMTDDSLDIIVRWDADTRPMFGELY